MRNRMDKCFKPKVAAVTAKALCKMRAVNRKLDDGSATRRSQLNGLLLTFYTRNAIDVVRIFPQESINIQLRG